MPGKRTDADRRIRQGARIARILRVLQLIQSHGRWNARAIAEEIEASQRTVYRDLQALELAGVPWHFDKLEESYRVRPDFRFPVLNLSDEELMGQAMATVLSTAQGLSIGLGANPTTRKLAAVSKEETGKLLHDAQEIVAVLNLQVADQGRHAGITRTVQGALLKHKQLSGQYASPYGPKPAKLTLHPYRIALIKAAWYLIGRPSDSDQPRTYRIARFQALRKTDAAAEVPEDFDLKQYLGNAWGVFRGDRSHEVEIEFSKEAAPLVTETIWHSTQKARWHRNGRVTLTFTLDGLNEIVRWILGWSGRARVIGQPELRTMVVEQLHTALKLNQEIRD